MFERFTQDARDVVVRARAHALRRDDRWIDTPHFWLALAEASTANAEALAEHGLTLDGLERAVAALPARQGPPEQEPPHDLVQDAEALAAFGIDLHRIREAVEAGFGPGALDRGSDPSSRSRSWLARRLGVRSGAGRGRLLMSTDAKVALELSLREAIRLKDRQLGEEHLTLGLLRGADTRTAAILAQLGTDPSALRRSVESRLRRSA